MSKKVNETTAEIKRLAGVAGEQLASGDFDGAWTTMGALNGLFKEGEHEIKGVALESLAKNVKDYYFQNKKYSTSKYALTNIGGKLSEISSLIKVEK